MTPSQLFKSYILTETPVVLELPSRTELTALMRALAGLKFRYLNSLKELGMEELDVFAGRKISSQLLEVRHDGTVRVRISLEAAPSISFTVVSQ